MHLAEALGGDGDAEGATPELDRDDQAGEVGMRVERGAPAFKFGGDEGDDVVGESPTGAGGNTSVRQSHRH